MRPMTDRSQIAVRTLMDVDPDFRSLVGALYGDAADAQMVWDDVFGGTPAELSKSHDALKALALASTVAGAATGVKEVRAGLKAADAVGGLRAGVKAARTAAGPGANLLSTGKQIAKVPGLGKVALGGGALVGDVDVVGQLRKPAVKPPTTPPPSVIKSFPKGFPKLEEHIKGLKAGAKKAMTVDWDAAGKGLGDFKEHPVKTVRNAKTATKVKGGLVATGAAAGVKHHRDNAAVEYGKGDDFEAEGTFSKFDDDKHLAFGWASVVKKNGQPVVDRQDDYIDLGDLEDAAYRYVHTSRIGGDMHKRTASKDYTATDSPHHVSDMVESMVITPEKLKALGLAEDALPHGWWVGFKVHDPATWDLVKKGERTGFSVHGKGRRQLADYDDIMSSGSGK